MSAPKPGFAATLDPEQTIPACFAQVAALHASRPAIGSGDWRPTYRELNAAACSFAATLHARGAAPGDRTAILMRHDGPQIAAVLGAITAGMVAVVLNETDPPARLAEIIADAEPSIIVTDERNQLLAAKIAGGRSAVVLFRTPPAEADAKPNLENPLPSIAPGDLAFLIYTSGSTGKPKGVMQTHRNVLHNAMRLTVGMRFNHEDRVNLLASLSGGQGISTGFAALLNGAALCPFPAMEKGVTGFAEWMREHRINVHVSSASLFRHFVRTLKPDERLSEIRAVRLGAESGTAEDFAQFQAHFQSDCLLIHSLSSSETGNITQCPLYPADKVAPGRLPIGLPASGITVQLCDDDGREVPVGECGEIIVSGRYISPGYWRNESLTNARFAQAADGTRLFRTGDLGRVNEQGLLMHAGRKDEQVKIRGYRIELAEVEGALNRLSEVAAAAVCVRTGQSGPRLAAFVVAREGKNLSTEIMRNALNPALPTYMIPATFVFLREMPLAPGGKIDRARLREIEPETPAAASVDPPATQTETLLAEAWREAFGRDSIGRCSNFFDLGGDSLIAAVVAAKIFEARRVELDLRSFADYPVLSDLAAKIDYLPAAGSAADQGLVRIPSDGPLPLSFQQEEMWARGVECDAVAEMAAAATFRKVRGPLNPEILRECMDHLIRRHEMLRTTFAEVAGESVQNIQPPAPVALTQLDFSDATDAGERAMQSFREEARRPMDLTRGPLFRFTLARIRPNEHWLLVVGHHIAMDAWSWKLYFQELGRLYDARLRGEPPPIPDSMPLRYADFAAWQRERMQPGSPAYRDAVAWWGDLHSRHARAVHAPFSWGHWWRKIASGRAPAGLPVKRLWKIRSVRAADGWIRWGIDPAASQRLDAIARQENTTYYVTRLTALASMLARECGRPATSLGIYLTLRNRVALQGMFGCFVNHAAVPLVCDPSRSFRESLVEVRRMVTEVQARAEIPFPRLCAELRNAGIKPLRFRVYFNTSDHTGPLRFGGLEWDNVERMTESMPIGFQLGFDQPAEDSRCIAGFDPRVYHPERVRRFLDRLAAFLDAASREPDRPVEDLQTESHRDERK